MRLFDSHAHIQAEEYAGDVDEVIARAYEAGVERVLLPSDDLVMARAGVALASRYDGLYASAGIHPHHASAVNDGVLGELEALLDDGKVVALGEIGLDYFYMHSPRVAQIAAFEAQLEIASRVGLPVIVHTRDAWEDARAVLGSWVGANPSPRPPEPHPLAPSPSYGEGEQRRIVGSSPGGSVVAGVASRPLGVMHYFTGSVDEGLRFVDMGFLLSIHTSVTFKNASAQREVVAQLPLESLVIETDSPFGAPQGYRGRRNEPAYVVEVAKIVAELQGVSVEDVAEATYVNACRLFRLPDSRGEDTSATKWGTARA
jgi:TatD DNase family protein